YHHRGVPWCVGLRKWFGELYTEECPQQVWSALVRPRRRSPECLASLLAVDSDHLKGCTGPVQIDSHRLGARLFGYPLAGDGGSEVFYIASHSGHTTAANARQWRMMPVVIETRPLHVILAKNILPCSQIFERELTVHNLELV